jgi:hypothetical protein
MSESLEDQVHLLLSEGILSAREGGLRVCSVAVEWIARDGKVVPRLTVVLEPPLE